MTPNRSWRHLRVLAPMVVALAGMGCTPEKPNTDMRLWTSEFEFRISADVVAVALRPTWIHRDALVFHMPQLGKYRAQVVI